MNSSATYRDAGLKLLGHVLLLNAHIVDEDELRDERPGLEVLVLVEVGNVANHEIFAVELDRVAFIDEPLEIVVTTDQFAKH